MTGRPTATAALRSGLWQRLGARLLSGLLAVCGAPAQASGQFVAPEGSNYHNGSSLLLEDDGGARNLLSALEEALVLGDGAEAAHLFGLLRDRSTVDLVRFGSRTHVPALERAARLLDERGPSLAPQVFAAERRRLDEAVQSRDLEALLDHASRGVSLPTAEDARWQAARLLFEQGRFWEAGALAAGCGERPGAQALVDAAARHGAPAPSRPSPGPWTYEFSFRERLDHHPAAAVPRMIDGRPGEVLLLDNVGLVGIDVEAFAKSFPDFDWGPRVMGMGSFVLGNPTPRGFWVARSGDRLVTPFNVTSEGAIRWRSPPARREPALVALDLLGEPVLAWKATPESASGSGAMGPPTIAGDRVFSLLFRVGLQAEVSLCAFSLASGDLLWQTPLVRGAFIRRFASRRAEIDVSDMDKRAREGTVAVVDGVVHACTGFGVVAAVDGVTGRPLHTFRYDRGFSLEKDVYDPAFLFDTGGWEHEPVRVHGERVVVAPSDSRFLYMLASEPGPAGQLILEDPIERLDRREIIALLEDPAGSEAPAVLATRLRDGASGLVLLSPDGHTLATSAPLLEGEEQTGPPARTGPIVLLPTTHGVRLFDATDLARPAGLLPRLTELPPPTAVWPLSEGLMVLHPEPEGVLHGVLWKQMR